MYQCSGWTPTTRHLTPTWTRNGARVSRYSDGGTADLDGAERGEAWIQRWEHRAPGDPREIFDRHWVRVPTGKTWRSGAPAYRYERRG